MDNLSTRVCLECQKPLQGRIDKRFCDSSCRNTFNNRNKSHAEHLIQLTNARMRKNRRVLNILCPKGKATVRKEVLDQMGYDYRYFTGLFKTRKQLYYLVYDYAFAPIFESGIEKALIVERQDFMDKLTLQVWKR